MSHECPQKDCNRRVKDSMLACPTHWRYVSRPTQRLVFATWDMGRGAGTDEHTEAVTLAIEEMNS